MVAVAVLSNGNGGTLTLTNSIVTGNEAWLGTPGIFNGSDSLLTVVDSIVSNNVISYEGPGGGIREPWDAGTRRQYRVR